MGNFDYSIRTQKLNKAYDGYASKTITISGVATDLSMATYSSLFSRITSPIECLIMNGGEGIMVKLNSTTNDSITVAAGNDFGVQGLSVQDIFVTTSGAATFSIFTLGWS
jgi:hypothetical protein